MAIRLGCHKWTFGKLYRSEAGRFTRALAWTISTWATAPTWTLWWWPPSGRGGGAA